MANLVTISDFVGEYAIQEDINTEAALNSIRDEYDRVYIRKLLGVELGNLFLTNFDDNAGVPTGRYATIYAAIQEDYNGTILESKGIKFFVKCIVWFYYARQNNMTVSTGGNKSANSQNSNPSNESTFYIRTYNNGIRTGRQIQRYIEQNISTYPEFNGQYLDMISL